MDSEPSTPSVNGGAAVLVGHSGAPAVPAPVRGGGGGGGGTAPDHTQFKTTGGGGGQLRRTYDSSDTTPVLGSSLE